MVRMKDLIISQSERKTIISTLHKNSIKKMSMTPSGTEQINVPYVLVCPLTYLC